LRSFQLFKLKLHLLQQSRLALRAAAVKLTAQLLDLKLEIANQGHLGLGARRFGLGIAATASACRRAARSAMIIACAVARSVGSDSEAITPVMEPHPSSSAS
jgi:hypothetical protein